MIANRFRIFAYTSVATLAAALLLPVAANAATVTSGKLELGDPRPSQTTSYTFSASGFTTATAIQCIQLRLNTVADGSGTVPTGVTTTGSTLGSSSIQPTWTTVGNTVNGSLRLTNATATAPAASGNVVWNNVVSGSTVSTTYYALFNTYTGVDCSTGPVDSTVVAFIYKDGALFQLEVDPSLAFTITGVASGLTVNGATTNIASTATGINFGRSVTTSVKGVSAHDLAVSTNASGGVTVNLRQTGNLTNGAQSITPWTGTNAAPTAFPGAGTEAWGYTTEDATLGGGTANRFTVASNWAGTPTTNNLVMDTTTTGSQTTRVGHQVGISASTASGKYNTTLVYTAAATY